MISFMFQLPFTILVKDSSTLLQALFSAFQENAAVQNNKNTFQFQACYKRKFLNSISFCAKYKSRLFQNLFHCKKSFSFNNFSLTVA
jgi:hypothetical protein